MFVRKSLTIILPVIFTLTFLAGCQDSQNLYGYDFNTAKISYKITGSTEGSSEVLIKGEKKKIHNIFTKKRADGTTLDVDSLLIQNGEKLYTLDPKAKTGSVVKQPFYTELKNLSPEQRKTRLIQESIRDNRSPEEKEKDPVKSVDSWEIAGQKCDVYTNAITQTCLWQAIPLKSIASLPEYGLKTETVADKIELNTDISDSEFDIPSDYQITELN
ncbi:hypothetical protein IT411_01815 [Candidatus Peregrinibacteria bacterium]|nr:hypothetical protein [Candidatus Peregrinibacteria bacterium]